MNEDHDNDDDACDTCQMRNASIFFEVYIASLSQWILTFVSNCIVYFIWIWIDGCGFADGFSHRRLDWWPFILWSRGLLTSLLWWSRTAKTKRTKSNYTFEMDRKIARNLGITNKQFECILFARFFCIRMSLLMGIAETYYTLRVDKKPRECIYTICITIYGTISNKLEVVCCGRRTISGRRVNLIEWVIIFSACGI